MLDFVLLLHIYTHFTNFTISMFVHTELIADK